MRFNSICTSTLHDAKYKTLSTNLGSKTVNTICLSTLLVDCGSVYIIPCSFRFDDGLSISLCYLPGKNPEKNTGGLSLTSSTWTVTVPSVWCTKSEIWICSSYLEASSKSSVSTSTTTPVFRSIANLVPELLSLTKLKVKVTPNPHHKLISESQSCQAKNLK